MKPVTGWCDSGKRCRPAACGNTTDVTWAMHGVVPYMAKLFCMVINGDRMVGDDFEAGLANLKTLVEREAIQTRARQAIAQ